jgi:biopolymer transport protein ExbB
MLEFLHAGGPFMWLLLLASVVALAFVIERGLALRWRRVIPPGIESAVERCESLDDGQRVVAVCQSNPSPLGRLLIAARMHSDGSWEEAVDAVQTRARQEILGLERGMVVLEVIVGVSPLLGLVGTIHGLITLFGALGTSANLESGLLAKGIAIALNTTLTGLLIAIPALIAWSYYSKKIETLAVEMETLCDEYLRRLQRVRRATQV